MKPVAEEVFGRRSGMHLSSQLGLLGPPTKFTIVEVGPGVNPQMKLVGAVELSWPMEKRCLRQEGSSFRLSSEKSRKHRKPKATRISVLLHQFHLGMYIRGTTGRAADGLQLSRRESAITGIWRVVFAWCSARKGYHSTAVVHSRSRSESSVTTAMASKVSVPTSTVTSGCATRL